MISAYKYANHVVTVQLASSYIAVGGYMITYNHFIVILIEKRESHGEIDRFRKTIKESGK